MQSLETTWSPAQAGTAPALASGDLETILTAWENATVRLQHTHEVLRDEVRRLTDELEVKNRALARKNRLADLGQMASHVAHEVRNSLSPVKLYLSLLKRKLAPESEAAVILQQAERGLGALESTVTDLLHFSADRDPVRTSISIRDLYGEIIESLAPQFQAQRIEVANRARATARLDADRDMLRRALVNLVLNAVDAMPAGGQLEFGVDQAPDASDASVMELTLADTGHGIPDRVLKRIYEPFFTTKSQGTGLGLAIVLRIVELHRGEIQASNRAGGGALFRLRFPQTTPQPINGPPSQRSTQ